VLVTGESGVGKEVVARAVHDLSARASEPFVAVNCGAIPETLIESELFGHARGAFTGADRETLGLFREADGGTLFLDEIGELPTVTQVKLLRVLQEDEVRAVGEPKPSAVDVRIITATAKDLDDEVSAGRFRGDLYYRLDVFSIEIPPLRERRDDIAPLADVLLEALCRRVGKPAAPLDRSVLALLESYDWPGNVRELENTLERALILARGDELSPDLFSFGPRDRSVESRTPERSGGSTDDLSIKRTSVRSGGSTDDLSIKRQGRELEQRLIRLALQRTGGNRTKAARILEISTRALQYKLKEYDIEPLNPMSGDSDKDPPHV
jgi:two-component system response regulator AtoC